MTLDQSLEQRFAELVGAHREKSLAMAWRLLGADRAAAEDVVQEAFLRAHRNLAGFRGDAQLSTWFYRILVNEVQRYRRWAWVRQRRAVEPQDDYADPAAAPAPDPALRERIATALDKLPPGQREAFVLVHLEGFSVREAAELGGRAIGTVKSHLHRALRTLRSELADLREEGKS